MDIEILNATWAGRLKGLNTQLWANMQAQGVTAEWVDPDSAEQHIFSETRGGHERQIEPHEFFEFRVHWRGNTVAQSTKHQVAADSLTATNLLRAANQMEVKGVHVMPV
ncbi:hypothetical protein [Deinococcus alpinitundrae]|uniref:hypothetical protein n=1 Tax=Deinococcus alpinitundrae TaxID=468913 RepID=UPI00137B18D5|nr:hypothetical protein [Deinococcus alpinitundrae]